MGWRGYLALRRFTKRLCGLIRRAARLAATQRGRIYGTPSIMMRRRTAHAVAGASEAYRAPHDSPDTKNKDNPVLTCYTRAEIQDNHPYFANECVMRELEFKSRYELQSPIGQGGMGKVYKAWDNLLKCTSAVKILNPETCANPRMRASFNREARAYALLNHPHVVKLFDFGLTESDQLYLSTELISGVSLNAINHSDFPLYTVIDILKQILDALEHAHQRVLIHCDIKAENVLITLEDHQICAKLADFGLATLPNDSKPDRMHLGTPAYMAPEQILNQTNLIGPCTDIYAVGILLYEALTGKLPYTGDSTLDMLKAHLEMPIPNIDWKPHYEGLNNQIKSALQAILSQALAKKPWQRFISVRAFREALESIQISPVPIAEDNPVWCELLAKTSLTSKKATEISSEDLREKIRAFEAAEDSGLRRSHNVILQSELNLSSSYGMPDSFGQNNQASHSYKYITEIARTHEYSIIKRDIERTQRGRGMQRLIIGGFGSGKTKFLKYISEKSLKGTFNIIACTPQPSTGTSNVFLHADDYSATLFSKLTLQTLNLLDPDQSRVLIGKYFNFKSPTEIAAFIRQIPSQKDPTLWDEVIDILLQIFPIAVQSNPIAILIDDLQRCSEPVYQFLSKLRMLVSSYSILVLVNYDPSELAIIPWISNIGERPEYRVIFEKSIVLGPVAPKNMKQILKSCWRIEDRLSMRIANESYGNPYYAMSMVKHLQQTSRLIKTPLELYTLSADDMQPLGVPETVISFLDHKIAELAPILGTNMEIYQEILTRTSIFGPEIYMNEVEQFWEMESDKALSHCWRDAIQAWCDLGMLSTPKSISLNKNSAQKLQFSEPWHAEAIQARIPERKKKALKAQAAIALIECYESPSYEELWRVAKLWRDASDPVAFAQFCYQSAENACELLDFKFALERWESLGTTFDAILSSNPPPNELIQAIDWSEALIRSAETALILDKYTAFEQFCTRLKTYSERSSTPVNQAHVQLLMAKQNLRRGNFQRAEDMASQAREQFLSCQDEVHAIRANLTRADAFILLSNIQNARVCLEDARAQLQAVSSPLDEAGILKRLSKIEWFAGNTRAAKEYIERAISIFQKNDETAEFCVSQLSANIYHFLEQPSDQTLYPLLNACETVADFQDEATAIQGKTYRLLIWILTANWESIHRMPLSQPSKIPATSLITGITVCARAIELDFNQRYFEGANEIATSLACFGPNNRRARAWCHTLMGLHGAITQNNRQCSQAFDRALNDFTALNDQFGILCVQLGQSLHALLNQKYETAFSTAKTVLISSILYQYSIQSTIAHAIALKAAIESKNIQWYSQCPFNFHCALPDLIKPVWTSVMEASAETMEQFDPVITPKIRAMISEIENPSFEEVYPSVEISL